MKGNSLLNAFEKRLDEEGSFLLDPKGQRSQHKFNGRAWIREHHDSLDRTQDVTWFGVRYWDNVQGNVVVKSFNVTNFQTDKEEASWQGKRNPKPDVTDEVPFPEELTEWLEDQVAKGRIKHYDNLNIRPPSGIAEGTATASIIVRDGDTKKRQQALITKDNSGDFSYTVVS